ncbi:MAG: carboxylesterase family protein, partial [Ilumatobacteraceae bacterium]
MTAPDPRATPPCGPVAGRAEGRASVFRGIPYARAERFARPRPLEPWTEPRDAGAPGAQAPQRSGALERLLGATEIPTDEHCQHVDVYTPAAGDRGGG